ncbi:ATP-binding cassette domain-containing protein [Neobacillus drentensis]|uniref:ATP-binding cassette domain-containing protein n=1 Tax=Neobacillus drentensis TaxID=220684 RepID=UPI002FFF1C6B
MKPKVVFSNVSKKYSLYKKKSDKLLQFLLNKGNSRSFYALNNISFEVFEGETIGVIGTNGSGKSTLSNLLARVIPPTEGTIMLNGETSLIAINVGLNNNITGLENIELKCLMHGLDKRTIKELTPKIIEFADIGDFIDQPVKSYSSGMKSRLGFAISVHTEPDILVVDEALSVGDQTFYEKCLNKINEFKSEGKTIFFISHSISQIKKISDRVLWLSFGEIEEFGDSDTVITKYNDYIKWFNDLSDEEKKEFRTKKLYVQKQEKLLSSKPTSRGQKRKNVKKPNTSLKYQIISLTLLTVILGILMFINDSRYFSTLFKTSGKAIETKTVNKSIKEEPVEEVMINKQSMVKANDVKIYSDLDQRNIVKTLPFSVEIYVTKEIDGVYQIKYRNEEYFLDKKNVELIDVNNLESADLSLKEDILSIFPEELLNSYQFFLAQLNSSYDEVKANLRGLTGESIVNNKKVLEYAQDHIGYLFNEENVAEAVVIDNINDESEGLQVLLNSAQLKSDDSKFYYVKSDQYIYIIDLMNKKITIQLR